MMASSVVQQGWCWTVVIFMSAGGEESLEDVAFRPSHAVDPRPIHQWGFAVSQ